MDSPYKNQTQKKFRSIDQQQLKVICDAACDKITDLFHYFNLEYRENSKFYSMCCPIHKGDNPSALNIYHIGDSYRGNWKCRTHQCEKIFKGSIIGFIRGIISQQKYDWQEEGDDIASFNEALEFIQKFVNIDAADLSVDPAVKDKNMFVANMSIVSKTSKNTSHQYPTRESVRNLLNIPSPYFLQRGFSGEILDKYDVGDCTVVGKEMNNRAVVPIYDTTHQHMVGCSGRSVCDKCDSCGGHHNADIKCETGRTFSKWRHSKGFATQTSLYNLWYAKECVQKTGSIIIVESPGNVWKLEMSGIHNAVAIYGSSMTDKQKMLLDISGAMNIYLLLDNDEAGYSGRKVIESKCHKTYNIYNIHIDTNDVADMSVEQIQEVIGKQIQ